MSLAPPRRARGRRLSATGVQALRVAGIVLLLLAGIATGLGYFGDRSARRDIARMVDADLDGLAAAGTADGLARLALMIRERGAMEPVDHPRAAYLLQDSRGKRLAGALPAQAFGKPGTAGLIYMRIGGEDWGLGRIRMLPGGQTLVAGRSTAAAVRFVKRITTLFLIGAGVVVVLAGLGAWVSSRGLQRKLDAFEDTFARLEAGDLRVRVPEDGGADELGVLARDVNHMLGQFERLLASQKRITDQTAHEIRTPLMHLDSTLVKALEACAPGDAGLLEGARAEIRGVVALLDSLLDIAALEAMQGERRGLAPVDVSTLARELAELYAASFDEAGLAFETRIAPEVTVLGDAMQTGRLISNLLDNAVKYVPSPGRVRLLVEPGPRLVVEDDGPGVAEADRETIFARYARGAARGPGHGLGLALVRAIAERQGLRAWVEDAAPGARFVVAVA